MRRGLVLAALSASTLCLNFLFQASVLVALGPGPSTDAFFASLAVPQFATAVLATAIGSALVPLLAGEAEERQRRDGWGLFLAFAGAVAVLGGMAWLAAPLWVPLLVPGFPPTVRELTIELTRVQLIGMVCGQMAALLSALYGARGRFVWAEAAQTLATGASLALLAVCLPRFGVRSAAWLVAARLALLAALLLAVLGPFARPDWRSGFLGQAWRRVRPLVAGGAALRSDQLLDRLLSSLAPAGGLSLLYFAQQLYAAATHVLNRSIAVPAAPLLASAAKAGEWRVFGDLYRSRLRRSGALALLALVAFVGAGPALLERFARGAGGAAGSDIWRVLLLALAGVLLCGALGQVTAVVFYAKGDTVTPTRIGLRALAVYLPAKVAAYWLFGLTGLAAAASLFTLATLLFQLRVLRRAPGGDPRWVGAVEG